MGWSPKCTGGASAQRGSGGRDLDKARPRQNGESELKTDGTRWAPARQHSSPLKATVAVTVPAPLPVMAPARSGGGGAGLQTRKWDWEVIQGHPEVSYTCSRSLGKDRGRWNLTPSQPDSKKGYLFLNSFQLTFRNSHFILIPQICNFTFISLIYFVSL